jgi:hypothetical protein
MARSLWLCCAGRGDSHLVMQRHVNNLRRFQSFFLIVPAPAF